MNSSLLDWLWELHSSQGGLTPTYSQFDSTTQQAELNLQRSKADHITSVLHFLL